MYSVQYVPSIASPQLTQQPISRNLAQCQEKLLHWRDGPLKNRVRRSGIFFARGCCCSHRATSFFRITSGGFRWQSPSKIDIGSPKLKKKIVGLAQLFRVGRVTQMQQFFLGVTLLAPHSLRNKSAMLRSCTILRDWRTINKSGATCARFHEIGFWKYVHTSYPAWHSECKVRRARIQPLNYRLDCKSSCSSQHGVPTNRNTRNALCSGTTSIDQSTQAVYAA